MALDGQLAIRAVERVARPLDVTIEEAAAGIIAIANQHMAQALRLISLERGHDPREHALVSFGGAGGLHVCALAAALGIRDIVVPAHCGVFSALGMLCANPMRQLVRTVNRPLDEIDDAQIEGLFDTLVAPGRAQLIADGARANDIVEVRSLDLRYRGQSYTLSVAWTTQRDALQAYHARHDARYGHAMDLPVELVNVRCELTAPRVDFELLPVPARSHAITHRTYATSDGRDATWVDRAELGFGDRIEGPALIAETMACTFVDAGWHARVDRWGHLLLAAHRAPPETQGPRPAT